MGYGPELIVNSTLISGAGWFCLNCNAGTAPKRQATVATLSQKLMTQNTAINFTAGTLYELVVEAGAVEINHIAIGMVEASGANTFLTWFNGSNGTIGTTSNTGFTDVSRAIQNISANRYRLTARFRPSANQGAGHNVTLWMSNADNAITYTSVIGQGINVHSVSLKVVTPDLVSRSSLGVGINLGGGLRN